MPADPPRHEISAGTVVLYFIVFAFITVSIFVGQGLSSRVTTQAERTCELQQQSITAILALGEIIGAARAETNVTDATKRAQEDFLVRSRRLQTAQAPDAVTRDLVAAVNDLAVLLSNPQGKATDPKKVLDAEDKYIALVKTLQKPRNCTKEFGK